MTAENFLAAIKSRRYDVNSPDFLKDLSTHRRLVRVTGTLHEIRSLDDINVDDVTRPKNTIAEIRLSRKGRELLKRTK